MIIYCPAITHEALLPYCANVRCYLGHERRENIFTALLHKCIRVSVFNFFFGQMDWNYWRVCIEIICTRFTVSDSCTLYFIDVVEWKIRAKVKELSLTKKILKHYRIIDGFNLFLFSWWAQITHFYASIYKVLMNQYISWLILQLWIFWITWNRFIRYTEKTIFPFPFTVNGIWSWWQFLNQMEFPFGSKTITTIISHSL